ncbi:hypothetical protein [Mastigocoleus testarum]|uniref:Uncharacterized protein n=1 Tax=Mastigocoleus testarum BC008 TaxID=371196 RepID=A0A0V7ZUV8_9CYAN|nr:hypothetical protein [Mastigocoleus testarum]KST67935.1 hypothetical protein BC008_31630 [Mastigocoleus testarum BC008]
MRKVGLLILAAIIVSLVWGGWISQAVSSQQFQSRINNLKFDLSRLESRVNRIESQLGSRGIKIPSNPSDPTVQKSTSSQIQRGDMFENLANLVIELKEDVKQLEERVSKLE